MKYFLATICADKAETGPAKSLDRPVLQRAQTVLAVSLRQRIQAKMNNRRRPCQDDASAPSQSPQGVRTSAQQLQHPSLRGSMEKPGKKQGEKTRGENEGSRAEIWNRFFPWLEPS